jgi:hypothetical protein
LAAAQANELELFRFIDEEDRCMKRSVMLALAIILTMISIDLSAAGKCNLNPEYDGRDVFKYKYECTEELDGLGYFAQRTKLNTNNLSLLNHMHGSGSISSSGTLLSEQQTRHTSKWYYVINSQGTWEKHYEDAKSAMAANLHREMTQSTESFTFGTGWYASHPIAYNSLLKENTVAKNYEGAAMMAHQLDYAHGYAGDMAVELNCTSPKKDSNGRALASMQIEDDVTAGAVHIGQLLSDTIKRAKSFKTVGWREPVIEADADYMGTFRIKKNIKMEIDKPVTVMEYGNWLPCCFCGYLDMDEVDCKPFARDCIFNCTYK